MVIISQYPLNTSEMAFYNTWSKIFGDDLDSTSLKSFQEATNNVGTMDTKITIPLAESVSVDKMMVTTGLISASTELTYTLTISNSAGEALSNVTISDNIPAKTSYVPGSAVANPPIVDLAAFPTTTAGFSLANNSSVVVTYKLAVSAAAQNGDILTNTVTVSATNLTQVLTDQAAVTVGSQLTRLYLPLVIK
jgi:uncharacterized repeat protein (TIGR01451 family)